MVQASHTPTVLTNPQLPDNPIVFANDAFLRLTGYSRDEILGRNCRFLGGPQTDRQLSHQVRLAIEEVRPVSARLLNYRRDGSTFWNQLHISPILDGVGRPAYFVGYQHDVTEQVEGERRLRQAHAALEERLEEREQLIYELHHRVRNNLQTVIGLLNLEARRADPSLRRQFSLITQRVRVLGGIHEQLESFGRWTAIDFGRHLRETCAALAALFEERIAVAVEAESLLCDIEAAAPLGLIANELIAGCFRQVSGSAAADQCLIRVVLRHHQDAGIVELAVSITAAGENGQPATNLLHPSDIVDVLAEQIGAELALDRTGSPTIRLTVPAGCFTVGLDGSPKPL
ncbi:signal transduction histidine kinase [Skermanella aerolata]|uniref:Signal transduction histidine kinase n=1 Tax=Skermanella aerolata TaxID=393310 RepID=A0A512E4P9_9PROT|nr:hypothetical protein N826_30730 [Skermanella aerolata KACC 11604]GEO43663.1 signal transduction histidine kinase [Skermanella aerolata]